MTNQTDQSGHELDLLIAEKVMGQIPCDRWTETNLGSLGGPALMKNCDHENCFSTLEIGSAFGTIGGCPRYSAKIQLAWEVVRHLISQGYDLILESARSGKEWIAAFRPSAPAAIEASHNEISDGRSGSSAETAICLAALRTLSAGV